MEAVTIIKYNKLKQILVLIFHLAIICGLCILRDLSFEELIHSIPTIVPVLKQTILLVIVLVSILLLVDIYIIIKLQNFIILDKNGFIYFNLVESPGFISWKEVKNISIKKYQIGLYHASIGIELKDNEAFLSKLSYLKRICIGWRIELSRDAIQIDFKFAAKK